MFDENEFRTRLVTEWVVACRDRDMYRFQFSALLNASNQQTRKMQAEAQEKAASYQERLRVQKEHFDKMSADRETRHINEKNVLEAENAKLRQLLLECVAPPSLFKPVDQLDMSVRLANGLERLGVVLLGDAVQLDEKRLWQSKNLGKKTIGELKVLLAAHGLRLGTKIPNWSTLKKVRFA